MRSLWRSVTRQCTKLQTREQAHKTTVRFAHSTFGKPLVSIEEERYFGRSFRTDDFRDVRYESRLDKIRETDVDNRNIRIHPTERQRSGIRKTMFSNLPWFYKGACPIKPDDNDLASQIDGVKHRVGGTSLPIDPTTLREFKEFVKDWIHKNLTPLDAETDVSVETWLKESPYTQERKDELAEIFERYQQGYLQGREVDFERLESFIKDEFYTCPKTFRTINSRVEIFKCLVGPTIHAVEKEVFQLPYFIKKIPVAERANYILNFLDPNEVVFGTDVSAWEGSMKKEILEACEVQLFDYMTSAMPTNKEFLALYRQLLHNNKLCFSGFMCDIFSRRMSGEMSTSIGNGFTNLMLILFTAFKEGIEVKAVVEGDDTLCSAIRKLTDHYARLLGFNLIMEDADAINEASFCGLIFSDEKHTLRDPFTCMMKLGWNTQQYVGANIKTRMQLLRAKALSLKCEMPNCPILGPLADRLIHLTEGVQIKKSIQRLAKHMSLYKRNEFLDLIKGYGKLWKQPADINIEARALMEKLYKVPVDAQVIIEEDIAKMELTQYSHPIIDEFIPLDNKLFWSYFVKRTPQSSLEEVVNMTERVNVYQTWLPLNTSLRDQRNTLPYYSLMVAA